MEMCDRINKVMIEAKRCGFEFSHLVVGRKELEEIENMATSWMSDEDWEIVKKAPDDEWTLKLIRTDDDECFQLCNMFNKEKEAEKQLR